MRDCHYTHISPHSLLNNPVRGTPACTYVMCRRTREDLKAANKRITTMLADYGDVVPRRDYEGLERSFQTLEGEHEQLKNDHFTLMEEHRWAGPHVGVGVCIYVVCMCMCMHMCVYTCVPVCTYTVCHSVCMCVHVGCVV